MQNAFEAQNTSRWHQRSLNRDYISLRSLRKITYPWLTRGSHLIGFFFFFFTPYQAKRFQSDTNLDFLSLSMYDMSLLQCKCVSLLGTFVFEHVNLSPDMSSDALCFHTSCVRALSPDSVSSLTGVERWDTDPSSSRSSSESSSDVLLMASSLGGGGALAAVFLWRSVSSLLLLLLPIFRNSHKDMHQLDIIKIYIMTMTSKLVGWDR